MSHSLKWLLAAAFVGGVSMAPSITMAEGSKSESMSGAKKTQAASDDFEENRKAHMQKSKENNANKGAN